MKKVIMFDREEVVAAIEARIEDLVANERNIMSSVLPMTKRDKTYLAGRAEEILEMVNMFDTYIDRILFSRLNAISNAYSGVL